MRVKSRSDFLDLKFIKENEFSIDKYNVIENLKDMELLTQLGIRLILMEQIEKVDMDDKTKLNELYEHVGELMRYIISDDRSECVVSEINSDAGKKHDTTNCLSSGFSVSSLSRYELFDLTQRDVVDGYGVGLNIFPSDEEYTEIVRKNNIENSTFSLESIDKITDCNSFVHLEINLRYTNEDIIKELSGLLSLWRKELNIQDRKSSDYKDWMYTKKRVIEYKIIPTLDVLNYISLSKIKVNSSVILLTIFPNGERDVFSYHKTILPFIAKLKDEDYMLDLFREISINDRG